MSLKQFYFRWAPYLLVVLVTYEWNWRTLVDISLQPGYNFWVATMNFSCHGPKIDWIERLQSVRHPRLAQFSHGIYPEIVRTSFQCYVPRPKSTVFLRVIWLKCVENWMLKMPYDFNIQWFKDTYSLTCSIHSLFTIYASAYSCTRLLFVILDLVTPMFYSKINTSSIISNYISHDCSGVKRDCSARCLKRKRKSLRVLPQLSLLSIDKPRVF